MTMSLSLPNDNEFPETETVTLKPLVGFVLSSLCVGALTHHPDEAMYPVGQEARHTPFSRSKSGVVPFTQAVHFLLEVEHSLQGEAHCWQTPEPGVAKVPLGQAEVQRPLRRAR